jgi:hypothetical protein
VVVNDMPVLKAYFGDLEVPADCLRFYRADPRPIVPLCKTVDIPGGSKSVYDAAYAWREGVWRRLNFIVKHWGAPFGTIGGYLRPADTWLLIDRFECATYDDGRQTIGRIVVIFPLNVTAR